MINQFEYLFSFRDVEGDVYESNTHETLQDAKAEAKVVREQDGEIVETWKYVNGEFKGRPTI